MKTLLSDLISVLRSEHIQNADMVFGNLIIELYNQVLSDKKVSGEFFESVLLNLCVANNRKLSVVNCEMIGKIAAIYLSQKKHKQNTKLLKLLQNEIKRKSLPAIIIFGNVIKTNGKFIFEESIPIVQNILKNSKKRYQRFKYQCLRRVIKGTGLLLKDSCCELFTSVLKGIDSDEIDIQIECIKSLPCLLSEAHLNVKKLIDALDPYMSTKSKHLMFSIAKSVSKMLFFYGSQKIIDEYGVDVVDTKKLYQIAFNTILKHSSNYRNIPTLCHTLMMWIRNIKPTELTNRIHLFTKFALSIVQVNLPVTYMCTFTRTVIRALVSVLGVNYEPIICHSLYEQVKKDGLTTANTIITLDALINFKASVKTLTKAAQTFYPLFAKEDPLLVRLVTSFFVVVGRSEPRVSQIFADSFVTWLQNKDAKQEEINGFSRGIAVLLLTANLKEETIQKVTDLCKEWLKDSSDAHFSAGLLLFSAIFSKYPNLFSSQIISDALNKFSTLFKSVEENSHAIKFGAILIKQIIQENSDELPSLYPIIQECALLIAQNAAFLSAPALLSLWVSIRKCNPSWHEKLPQTMMNATPTILARFFNPEDNPNDYGMRSSVDEVDQAEILFGTNLPKQYATICTDKMETIYTLLVSDIRTPMRDELVKVALNDYCAWAVLSPNSLKKVTLNQLYSPNQEQDQKLFFLRLTLIRAITAKPNILQFIRTDCLRILFSFETKDIRTTRALGAAIASYFNINDEKIEMLLEFIESPKVNGSLVAAVISELQFTEEKKLEAIRCMLSLERLIIADKNPLEVFALSHLIEEDLIPDNFIDQTLSIIEQIVFSDGMILPENVFYLSKCIDLISMKSQIKPNITSVFVNLPLNKTLGLLMTLKTSTKENNFITQFDFSIEKPLPILTEHISFIDQTEEVPLIVNILQQNYSKTGENKIRELFFDDPDFDFWILLAKQIIIKGSVPFVGCGAKVIPSLDVINVLINIVDLISQRLRRIFPEEKEKLKEVISLSLAVLSSKETSVHYSAFNLLAKIIEMYSDISTELQEFDLEFKKAFNIALDKSHCLDAGITFILTYFDYLTHKKDDSAEETSTYIIEVIKESKGINFIRLAGKFMLIIGHPIKEIAIQYISSVESFISDVCAQKAQIKELRNEIFATLTIYMKLQKDFMLLDHFTMSLAREMELEPFSEQMLRLLTVLIMRLESQRKELIDYSLEIVGNSEYYKYEMENYEMLPIPNKQNAVLSFLAMCASNIPPNAQNWENTFKKISDLSLHFRTAYAALALLVRCAPYQTIVDMGPQMISIVMRKETVESDALIELIFARMQVSFIDKIITDIIQCNVKPAVKFNVIKIAMKYTKNSSLTALNNITQITALFMFPYGANFLGYILGNPKTVVYGLNILRLGVADYLMTHKICKENLSVAIDLFIIATERMKVLFPTEFWPKQTVKLAIKMLLKLPPDDKTNISHLFALLRTVDQSVLSSFLEENKEKLPKIFAHLNQVTK